MNFDKLTTDLEQQDATIRLCAAAIRKRAEYLKKTQYEDDTVALVRNVALWLESEQGRGCVLDMSIKEQMATPMPSAEERCTFNGFGRGVRCWRAKGHKGECEFHKKPVVHPSVGNACRCGFDTGTCPIHEPATPSSWPARDEGYRAALERIASHEECTVRLYEIAADALCWARKHRIEVKP